MPEIGVKVNGGPISVWVDCDQDDPFCASVHALRDPVVRALLVGREYERAEWFEARVLNLITKPASNIGTDRPTRARTLAESLGTVDLHGHGQARENAGAVSRR